MSQARGPYWNGPFTGRFPSSSGRWLTELCGPEASSNRPLGIGDALRTDLTLPDLSGRRRAVTDLIGNAFAGISNDTDWNFSTVADTTNPLLVLPTSVGGAAGVTSYEQLIDYIVDRFVAASEVQDG